MQKTKVVLKFEKLFKSFSKFYAETLNYWINKNKTIITFIFIVLALSALLYKLTPKELLPMEDRGVYLVIGKTDEGSSFQYTA